MTPSKHCKALTGLKISEISKHIGKPRRTIENWHKDNPKLFEAVCIGVMEAQKNPNS